ncbi:hypothetical protein BN946_scf184875.g4 [Trametes cinnabarina]|uniref:Uncharacterized protein n=1 Tax=Pycnoporus cinnabarinus TaxID=5643 RepID=A0A060S5V9_PYCCI|nr:hypothetical protein BN946_scf184875.g4 [Trametes cinnabarina]
MTTPTIVQGPPIEDLHPIHDVIVTLLEWFSARYQLLAPKPKTGTSLTQPIPPMSGAAARRWARNVLKDQPTVSSPKHDKDRHELESRAEKIKSYEAMLDVLHRASTGQWPDADRLPDQLSPTYDPHKPQKFREKRSRAEGLGDVEEQPSSKRQRSTASQT